MNDTPAAVRWADARIREREADAITVSTHPGDGGANTGSGGAHAGAASVHAPGETADVGPDASLPVALESEGFERLSGT